MEPLAAEIRRLLASGAMTESEFRRAGIPSAFAASIAADAAGITTEAEAGALADRWALTIARTIDAAFAA